MTLDYTVNGREQQALGAGHPEHAPYATYQCAARGDDDDRWIAITVTNDSELQALAEVAEQPGWASLDPQDLDSEIARWTRTQTAEVLMHRLQEAGVPAGVVQTPEDLRNDPQLAHRGHFWMLDHPTMGHRAYDGPSFRLSRTPAELTKAAPLLGEDNEYIYKDIVGMSDEEYVEHLVSGAFD